MGASSILRRVIGVAALSTALAGGIATAAEASPVPPKADPALLGVWVNTDPASRSVKQVDITGLDNGTVSVDAFGSCTPTLCEWGSVPAIVYGANVSSPSGATFQTNQAFLSGDREWSRTTLVGSVTQTASGGRRLTLQELTVFEDGSGRKNYTVTETFVPGRGQLPTRGGVSVSNYVPGAPPLLAPGAFGHWVAPTSSGLVALDITNTAANPVVDAFGACSPTPCDWGTSKAITYGASISSVRGRTALAPYSFGFKNSPLLITYRPRVDKLVVSVLSEFTDGSGRSNYVMTETLHR